MAVTANDIAMQFNEASGNPSLVQKCVQICNEFGMSGDDLNADWDLLVMNRGKRAMSLDALGELEAEIRKTHAAKRAKTSAATGPRSSMGGQFSSRPNTSVFNKDTAQLLGGILSSTPTTQKRPGPGLTPLSGMAASPSDPSPNGGGFSARADSGKVMCTLNPHLGAGGTAAGATPVQLGLDIEGGASAALGDSMMWEKLDERARMLDNQLRGLEELLESNETFPPLASVVATGADEVAIVGRVCCEGEGKLNLSSIFLEGSRSLSNAMRVRLDLSSCPEFALFPGQVVGAIGVNAVGHTFVARKIIATLPARAESTASDLKVQRHPVSAVVAAGPFCTSDDLTYAPLSALLTKAAETNPDVLVLVGPFVDEQHPSLASANVPVSYQELFERQVLFRISEFIETQLEADSKVTRVVLLPSTRDLHHQPVYPQPAFESAQFRASGCVPAHVEPYLHLASNPASVVVGGVRFGACAVDTLFLLGQQELARNPPDGSKPDRMARLASHVLQQRALLPLFPVPSDERSPLAVDVVANLKDGNLPALPHVLICPSELAPFAKVCSHGVVAVNPGRLTRKTAGGNYATVCVHLPEAEPDAPVKQEFKEEMLMNDEEAPEGETPAGETPAGEAEAAPAPAPAEEPDLIMEAALAATGAAVTPAPSAAASEPAVKVEAEATADKGAVSCVLPAAADAPKGLGQRTFVEVKKI